MFMVYIIIQWLRRWSMERVLLRNVWKINPPTIYRRIGCCIFRHQFLGMAVSAFDKGMCVSAKMLYGAINAVSSSSSENSIIIIKRGLRISNKAENRTSKPWEHLQEKFHKPNFLKNWGLKWHLFLQQMFQSSNHPSDSLSPSSEIWSISNKLHIKKAKDTSKLIAICTARATAASAAAAASSLHCRCWSHWCDCLMSIVDS